MITQERIIMNSLDEYSHWTDETAVYPKLHEPHYLALGLCEELGELARAQTIDEVVKEAGDVFWYAARYARLVLDIPFSVFMHSCAFSNCIVMLSALEAASIIAGVEKKRLRDGETWSVAKRNSKNAAAAEALQIILKLTTELSWRRAGVTLSEIIRANQAKLIARKAAATIHGDGDNR